MKISYRWLKDYVDFTWDAEELADKLTMVGLEVESVEDLAPEITEVYVGEILEIEPHPNAKLNICQISVGDKVLNIVCGAPNVRVGMKVPVAVEGAVLPNGTEIKATDLRGVMSYGMACSEVELGLGEDDSGLLELPDEVTVGTDLITALSLDDQVIDVSIYANRPDCMSVIGIAREVAALAGTKLKYPTVNVVESERQITDLTSVEVIDTKKCPRYSVRVIENITITDSPLWMQQKLRTAGMRPINNVVDITNFVMLETGQPLHAFDFDKLTENRIVVRTPKTEEKTFVTLDGVERDLTAEMTLICDEKEPVCIAGVMGGENSEVTSETKNILLESANFAAANIRRTSRAISVSSEAAARYEKGIDPSSTVIAVDRAAALLAEYANGSVACGIIDVDNSGAEEKNIKLRPQRVNQLLGTEIPELTMVEILEHLEFTIDQSHQPWLVTVPAFRRDLELETDLIEEIGRYWGFENIPTTLPGGSSAQGGESYSLTVRDQLRARLVGYGLSETMSYSFVSPNSLKLSKLSEVDEYANTIPLANALTEDLAVMRTTLMPSLLDCVTRNVNRQQSRVSLFEISSIFVAQELPLLNQPQEPLRISVALSGARQPQHWSIGEETYDIYDIKGVVEGILAEFSADYQWLVGDLPLFHPGRQGQVTIGDQVIAKYGEVHPDVQKSYRIPDLVYLAEIDLEALLAYPSLTPEFKPLPKFPASDRDMAILVAEDTPVAEIVTILQEAGGDILRTVEVFDVYQGKQIEAGKKSVAFAFVFQSDHTLTDEEINRQMDLMYQAVKDNYNAVIR